MTEAYAGIDVGGTQVKIGFVNSEGEVLVQTKIDTLADSGYEPILQRIAETVHTLQKDHPEYTLKAAGVGMAGQLNVKEGILIETQNLSGWDNVPMGQILKDKLQLPVFIDNDATVAAWGEFLFGAGKGTSHMLMVTLGTGVGGGLILNGKLFHGANDVAAEFGHTKIAIDGPMCACNRQGCLEAFIGTRGLLNRVNGKIFSGWKSTLSNIPREKLTPKDISEAALKGDEVANDVLRETGEYLGLALSNVANLLNLEIVVVGGGVANAGDLIFEPARKVMFQKALTVHAETISLVPASLGESAGLIGAAALAFS